MLPGDDACTVSTRSGLFTATPIALINNVRTLVDCILLCMKSLHCLSGCYSDRICLHFDAVASDNSRDLVPLDIKVTYFAFSCIEAPRKRKSFDHGHYSASECGLPAFESHGQSSRMKRIVRGARAQPYTQPWLGQVIRAKANTCGASLISARGAEQTSWAVSAAHCFLGQRFLKMGLIFGTYDLRYVTPHVIYRKIVNVVSHPRYGNQENDIALIKMEKAVIFNAYVRPLCLPHAKDKDLVHSNACSVCGYGATEVNGNTYPTTPHCFHVEMGNSFLIRRQVWNFNPLRSTVSATDTFRYKGVSEGDSGGPLTCKRQDRHFLAGIVYAKHVGAIRRSQSYNFFVDIPKYVRWIQAVTGIDSEESTYQ